MSNRKKYVARLIKLEKLRKKRLVKKLKRQKKLHGRRKDMLAKAQSTSSGSTREKAMAASS